MELSVIICSYNRCQSLGRILDSFQNLSFAPEAWELLIVDNNSTDETRSVAEGFIGKGFINLKYIFEGLQGKSYALNTGIRESRGKILAFTDDDCVVDSNWLLAIMKEFKADPSLGGIGGRVELHDKAAAPIAQRTLRERLLLSRPDHPLSMIIGCNMAFRRNLFDVVGGFDVALGPGTKIGAVSEDLDFLYRVYKAGFKLVYSPDVLVYHNHGRSDNEEIAGLRKRYIIGRGALYCKHIFAWDRDILKLAYWEISTLLKSLLGDLVTRKSTAEQRRALWGLFIGATYQLTRSVSIRKRARTRGTSSGTIGNRMLASDLTKHD